MCGRYRIKDTDVVDEHMRRLFNIPKWAGKPRYNMAPSQELPVLARDGAGQVRLATMRWGFVPFWEKSEKPRLAPINAQSEKVASSAMFRQAVQQRRCLVPADGFYEWKRLDEKLKVPFDIHLRGGRPFYFAGIYENESGQRPSTYAILTTRPNELVATIHDRMPAILDDDAARRWLEPGTITPEEVAGLTAPHAAADMEAVAVSSLVNSPRNDVPECLEPVAFQPPPKPAGPRQGELF